MFLKLAKSVELIRRSLVKFIHIDVLTKFFLNKKLFREIIKYEMEALL